MVISNDLRNLGRLIRSFWKIIIIVGDDCFCSKTIVFKPVQTALENCFFNYSSILTEVSKPFFSFFKNGKNTTKNNKAF